MESWQRERFLYQLSWVLLVLLAFVAVFGSYLMPHPIGEDHKKIFEWVMVKGVKTMVSPPFSPGHEFWLGSDHRGYDMLSLVLNGAKYTLGFAGVVTLLRFLIALPIGLFAGATGRGRSLVATLQLITTSVPPLLFVFPATYGLYQTFGLNQGASPFDPKDILFTKILLCLLVVIGVFQVAHQFAERATFYSGKEFVTASKTMGASTWRIIGRHLLPHLRAEMLFSFFTDFVQVLFLLGQLAVVGIFIGGGEMIVIDPYSVPPTIYMATQIGEWGGLISYGSHVLRSDPWIVATPGLCYTGSILILSFFSSRLQKRLEHPYVYKTKPLVQDKPALAFIGAVAVVCVAMIVFVPNKSPQAVVSSSVTTQEQAKNMNPFTPKQQADIRDHAQQIMQYLAQGHLDYAMDYVAFGAKPPEQQFQKWESALVKHEYQFVQVGDMKQISNDPPFPETQVEVKMRDKQGKLESWYLIMVYTNLLRGKGGPQ